MNGLVLFKRYTWGLDTLELNILIASSFLIIIGKVCIEIWHFATVLCNWKFVELPKTSCMKIAVACDSRIIQVHTVGLYSFIHPYFILVVGRAIACNYKGYVHTALHVN
jgi:hypothetical protein